MGSKFKRPDRKATKGQGVRWKKGQSSSHNPTYNKFRQLAKKQKHGEGKLTEAVLAQHNEISTSKVCQEGNDSMTIDENTTDVTKSVGGETALTAFTNCTLPSFDRLLKNWNSSSFLHKQMAAVLAAVTDILQKEGRKETETDYFAALLTTLDVVETDEDITAVICLLAMLVNRLNESVLKSQYKTATEAFVKLLIKYMNSDYCALLRNLLKIIYHFLRIKKQWGDVMETLKIVLEFTTHQKPKVRKVAQSIVSSLLTKYIPENSTSHPCAPLVANFCVEKLENSGGKSSSRDVFYILSLLREIIGVLPKPSIKKCCETIFKSMTLSTTMVTLHGLKALQGLFGPKSISGNLTPELNARLITALYDYQPNVKDSECLAEWLQLMASALMNLYKLDSALCKSHLPKFFAEAVKCWQNETTAVMSVVTRTLVEVLESCVPVENADDVTVKKMFHSVEEALSYQYHKAWSHVIGVLARFFERLGKQYQEAMLKCLQSLGNLHDSYNFPHTSELEKAIGVAVQSMGPRIVLKAIPLKTNGEKADFERSWMLPLLRDYTRNTELEFFITYFYPLAETMKVKSLVLKQEQRDIESKLFEVVWMQIWSLLPGFCTEPTDLHTVLGKVFPSLRTKTGDRNFAQTLGEKLKTDPDLKITILSAIRLLVSKNIENPENREVMSCFAKNYIPILFNLYTRQSKDKSEERNRLAVYDTLKVYLQIIATKETLHRFEEIMKKLKAEDGVFMKHALLDLCKALIPYIPGTQLQELFDECKPLLQHPNHTVQKKAYSTLKEICCCKSEACVAFTKSHLQDFRSLLEGNKSGLPPATRALRLVCLQNIVAQLNVEDKATIIDIIPEAVLCTKEVSLKARTAAYDLLVAIGNAFMRFQPDDKIGALREYMELLIAGFAGSPHFMSATVLSIGRVLYDFKDELDSSLIHVLIENMCLLLSSKSREVVDSALSFVKILFSTVPLPALAQHVQFMVKSLTSISEDNQRPFRFKAKEIFTRLVRKFGIEMISKLVPESHKKQLKNIRKIEARKKRKRDTKNLELDSDDEMTGKPSNNFEDILADSDDDILEEAEDSRPKVKARRRKMEAPCIEETPEEIVDFLDPSANKKILAARPRKSEKQHKKASDNFPLSEDGRLIIEDEETKPKARTEVETEEKTKILSELGAIKKSKRKFNEMDDDDETERKPIGVSKGIHRTLEPVIKRKRPGEEFKAKKAGGDMKKGKTDPYAYVPLNRQALNKRKQVKFKGQFKSIVKGAKRGATSGSKRKARHANRNKKHK